MHLKSFMRKDRYGNEMSVEFYDVPPMQTPEYDHPGEPKGPDTVPAWLTPGEFVINAEATRKYEPLLEEINNEGRAIQQAQGGTIPEYKGEGGITGFFQDALDSITMPQAPPGIEYRRMPDGSIGQFTKRVGTGGGRRYLGKLESSKPTKQDRDTFDFSSLYNSKGGPIYAQEGTNVPSWLTDDLLDSLKMVESGGDVDATSEAGAMGAYQIMPSTAAKPGMGVTPLAIEDIRDPDKSRQFAKDYLTAIARENPDFTQEEVLTAYHSGAGNVRKAKEGTETLGERGQSYAGKILSALNPISAAEASVPKMQAASVPKPDEEGFLSPQMKRFLMYPLESFGVPVPEDAPGEPVGNKLFGTESTIIKDEQAERALKYPGEFIGLPVPVDAPGVPNPNVLDLLPDQDKVIANLNENRVTDRQAKVDTLANRINENQSKGIPVSPELVAAHQEATQSLKEAQQIQQQHASEVSAKVTEAAEATAKAQTYNTETGKFDKPEAIPEYEIDTVDLESQKKAAEGVIKQLGPVNEITPEGDASINNYLASLDDNSEEKSKFDEQLNTAKGWFAEAFKDMFSGPELARMVINYVGSRALGYDHGSSLNYSMKQYVTRVDQAAKDKKAAEAKLEERRFDLAKSNLDNYTAASAQKFMETLDPNDLVPKSTKGTVIKEVSGSVNFIGKGRVNTYKDDDGIEYVKLNEAEQLGYPNGYVPVSVLGKYIQPWDEKTMGAAANRSYFSDMLERSRKNFSTDEFQIDPLPVKLATQLNAEFNDYVRKHGVGINEAERTRIQFAEVVDKFMADVAKAKREGTPVPTDIAAYVQSEMVIPLTGINSAFLNGISTKSMAKLDKKISQSTNMNPYEDGYDVAYQENWKIVEEVFNRVPVDKVAADALAESIGIKKIVPREDWTNRAEGKDETAFSLWLANTSLDEIQKLSDHFKL